MIIGNRSEGARGRTIIIERLLTPALRTGSSLDITEEDASDASHETQLRRFEEDRCLARFPEWTRIWKSTGEMFIIG
jgi:hypothetical protein